MRLFTLPLLLIGFCSLSSGISSCKKSGTGETLQPFKKRITPKGIPNGQMVEKTIGPGGGTIESSDGTLKILVPSGAVDANTAFSLQLITNTLEEGSHLAFRLLPEGSHFLKPVTLVFSYEEQDLVNTKEELLFMAYQGKDGAWYGVPTALDKNAKTLSVETTHFSDWTIFEQFELRVSKTIMGPDENVEAVVYQREEDLLPSTGTQDSVALGDFIPAKAGTGNFWKYGNWQLLTPDYGELTPQGEENRQVKATFHSWPGMVGSPEAAFSVDIRDFNLIRDPNAPGGQRLSGKVILLGRVQILTGSFLQVEFAGVLRVLEEPTALYNGSAIIIQGTDPVDGFMVNITIRDNKPGSYPCGATSAAGTATVIVINPEMVNGTLAAVSYASEYTVCGPPEKKEYATSPVTLTAWGAVGQMAEGIYNGSVYRASGSCNHITRQANIVFKTPRGL